MYEFVIGFYYFSVDEFGFVFFVENFFYDLLKRFLLFEYRFFRYDVWRNFCFEVLIEEEMCEFVYVIVWIVVCYYCCFVVGDCV